MLLLAISALGAWSDIRFYVEPTLQKGFGGSSYDLSFDAGGGVTGLSRLEFPEVSLDLGIVLGLFSEEGDRKDWLIEAAAHHSLLSIPGTMYDYDWTQQIGYPKIPFSYTYSNDSTVSWDISLDAAWTFASGSQWSLALLGMYRYQDLSHVEDSVTGWQYIWNGASYDLNVIVDYTKDVLEYRLLSHTIGLGILSELKASTDLQLELRACFTPVFATDRDDHVLRTKLSTASGWGLGAYADLKARYNLRRRSLGPAPYVVMDVEFNYYSINTTQTQYWYGNADSTPQGTLIAGVGHVITSTQFQVGLRFGFLF